MGRTLGFRILTIIAQGAAACAANSALIVGLAVAPVVGVVAAAAHFAEAGMAEARMREAARGAAQAPRARASATPAGAARVRPTVSPRRS